MAEQRFLTSKKIGLVLGPVVFIFVAGFVQLEGLNQPGHAVLATALWMAIWWVTEAVPIAMTSLLPIILFPLTGGLEIAETTASYGHKYIFLFIGGFIIAIAIERYDLHKRIALNIIRLIGGSVSSITLGFMLATAFLSMWISNTATSLMMVPIGMAVIAHLRNNPFTKKNERIRFGKMLMLAIAYSASIGGIATLIGTPPNLVLAGVLEEIYGIEISFARWMLIGLPVSVLLLFICWWYLTRIAFKMKKKTFPAGTEEIRQQLQSLGGLSYEERAVLIVFVCTALAWILRTFLLEKILPSIDDTIIALVGALVLFIIPASRGKKRALLSWEEAVRLPWGIILLFGGGLALAQGFGSTGLAEYIGSQITALEGIALILLLLILIAAINFLTEITSNLATTAMILPILAPLALAVDVHPYILMVGATMAASCAFMLPVATPPNAVVFGSGYLSIPDMAKTGVWMNFFSIILLTLFVYFILPLLWNFDPSFYPPGFLED